MATQTGSGIKGNFRRAKVLVIEDNDDHWVLIEKAMQQCLEEVICIRAVSSSQALALLGEWSLVEWEMPKLILLDLYLPRREDGWKLLGKIKDLPSPFNQIPVVALSSSDNPTDIIGVYQRGGASYLVKPTEFSDWQHYFRQLRSYWWETVTLPSMPIS